MMDAPRKSAGDSPLMAMSASEQGQGQAVLVPDPAERVAAALRTIVPANIVQADARTNPLLDKLVYGDNDLVGLVAYAMHEVNRRDWRAAYETTHGRPPSEAEYNAYLVGEQLERRLETYRRLAEDAIAKVATGETNMRRLADGGMDPPRAPTQDMRDTAAGGRALHATSADKAVVPPEKSGDIKKLALYLVFLLIAVAGLAYLLRYGIDAGQLGR